MIRGILSKVILTVLLIGLTVLSQSPDAFAQHGKGNFDGRHAGSLYRYHGGRFYRPVFFGLFEILVSAPPAGAVVKVLPAGRKTFIAEGAT
ncbi:MAG: hypothetical protein PHO34_01380, partial [Candidatus Omnitrophica bacterium]|nr:hypothetical protein [Candidatus Omnitrophota bacterium]